MTEDTHLDDDNYIVRVQAVVMTRDDSSGGWVSQELSYVGVNKIFVHEGSGRSDFLIIAEQLKDKKIAFECCIQKDLVYTQATPTFRHWKIDNKKFGLTFSSPAEAREFDRGVNKAIEDLNEGSTTSSSTLHNEAEIGDDDVFTVATDSSSNSSQKIDQSIKIQESPSHREHRHLFNFGHICSRTWHDRCISEVPVVKSYHHVSYQDDDDEIVRINPREKTWQLGYEDYRHTPGNLKCNDQDEGDSYVHIAKRDALKHDYSYPSIESFEQGLKSPAVVTQPSMSVTGRRRKEDGERSRCVYCRDMFNHEENGRGQCQDAPDPIRTCIHRATCMWCADTMLYHCMSDPEGDYSDPCSCDTSDEKFCLRWMALIALSFVAPGMCCYLPLRACHHCGVMCNCCGGKHKAAV
ncbi:sprouty-related, EVH1 domain-containing protein 2 [Protopterus annectens]|uniref:sprouty-related, EVH1 domain-containing protein 2 n=1 Tax=Protopterus annectens TaxID=7888 RepID=UPI001CF9DEE5|nr:sprouty-related, EVH1 domain-containing protein 2 [Protopterus annectens]